MMSCRITARLFAGALSVWLGACGADALNEHNVAAPETARVNEQVALAVTGTFGARDQFQWSTTGGRLEGPLDRPTVTFVPTAVGTATVVLTLRSESGSTIVRDATIRIVDAVAPVGGDQTPRGTTGVPLVVANEFVPSGWMGDAAEPGHKYVTLAVDRGSPHSSPASDRISYSPGGPAGWAAVAWQYPENNWGDRAGKDLRGGGYREVSIWAKGVPDRRGNLPVVQFKAGGATNPTMRFPASFEVAGDFVTLTAEWKEYILQLTGRDLSNVAAAFVVVMRAQDVDQGVTFFLDDIRYR